MARDVKQQLQPLVTELLGVVNKVVQDGRKPIVEQDGFHRLISYLEELQPLLTQLQNMMINELPPGLRVGLDGIKTELQKFQQQTLHMCKSRSRLYLLIHCRILVENIQETTHTIAQWLSLIPAPARTFHSKELSSKTEELARTMLQAQFLVPEDEEAICSALEMESRSEKAAVDITTSSDKNKAVQKGLVMDISRVLGVLDFEKNSKPLSEQLRLVQKELVDCTHPSEKELLKTVARLLESVVAVEPEFVRRSSTSDAGENEPLPPFEAFLCPLTKQVMKDPVVAESEMTYEREAIQQWFDACQEQGREPMCPVSGQIVKTTKLRPNLVLQKTIQEWTRRNVVIRMRVATTQLSAASSIEEIEHALDDVTKFAEEDPTYRQKLREVGVIPLILGLWQSHPNSGTHIRHKALKALRMMAVDNIENKEMMVELGVSKLAVKSLGSSLDKEKETAVTLLHELSLHPHTCAQMGSEKGAILFLVGLTTNVDEDLKVASLAEKTLKNLEQMDVTVLQMAEAGRLQPLLSRLCEGSEETQVKMAEHLAQMTLTNTSKEMVARSGTQVLVKMLLSNAEAAKEASLGALFNLSLLEDTATVLIKAGVLGQLLVIMFSAEDVGVASTSRLKEMAANTLANLVSIPGNWERAKVDEDGHTLKSEETLHNFLELLTDSNVTWKEKIIKALYYIASSPQASVEVATHMRGKGIVTLVTFLQDPEAVKRLQVLRLLSVLSLLVGVDIATALRSAHQLVRLKELLQAKGKVLLEERVSAANLLANIPLTEFEVICVLEMDLLPWTITMLDDVRSGKMGKLPGRLGPAFQEGLVGLLLHFARNSNMTILNCIREQRLFTVFLELLVPQSSALVKERAALGLQLLATKSSLFMSSNKKIQRRKDSGQGLCFMSLFRTTVTETPHTCSVHRGACDANTNFCLVVANALVPLVEHLEEEQGPGVQQAVLGALSTLLLDEANLGAGVTEILKSGGVQPIFELFYAVRQGELQEKAVWMIERILRTEEYAQGHTIDQALFQALIEAFKHGSPTTRALAQDSLTHLKQISVVSSGPRGKSRAIQRHQPDRHI
ncbi:hypothetical protein CY35_05G026000 [Sphagnum magellanicum]|jgi:hypothetical protein|nr:hypothetical protein CY35_05G026000 [Sphagnum magellanicum]